MLDAGGECRGLVLAVAREGEGAFGLPLLLERRMGLRLKEMSSELDGSSALKGCSTGLSELGGDRGCWLQGGSGRGGCRLCVDAAVPWGCGEMGCGRAKE